MSHKHLHLLQTIYHDPISANIHWREIESLLSHLGASVESAHGGRVRAVLNRVEVFLHHPHYHQHQVVMSVGLQKRCSSTSACASSCVNRPAGMALQPDTFCPAHRGEKSLLPALSARLRNGEEAAVAMLPVSGSAYTYTYAPLGR